MAMHSAVLLADENRALRAANKKQKRKQGRTNVAISQGGVLTVAEDQDRTERAVKERLEPAEHQSSKPKKRAPSRCSLCSSFEHTARSCQQ